MSTANIEDEAEHQIISVKEFQDFVHQYDQYLNAEQLFFRAQMADFTSLSPSISRPYCSKRAEARRIPYKGQDEKELFRQMALAQHSGRKTRLLDFTIDPLTALYFAVNDQRRDDSLIFIFIQQSEPADSAHAKVLLSLAGYYGQNFHRFVRKFNKKNGTDYSEEQMLDWSTRPVFIKKGSFQDAGNRRMEAQKGTFAICGNRVEQNQIEEISKIDFSKRFLAVVVPFEYKADIRKQLTGLGVTPGAIFPDLVNTQYAQYAPFEHPGRPLIEGRTIVKTRTLDKKVYHQYTEKVVVNGKYTIDELKEYCSTVSRYQSAEKVIL